MKFVGTPIFKKVVRDVLSDDDYRSMLTAIMFRPEQGVVIRGTGGIRKLRWSGKGHGKSGGLRLIYFGTRNRKKSICYMSILRADRKTLPRNNVNCLAVS